MRGPRGRARARAGGKSRPRRRRDDAKPGALTWTAGFPCHPGWHGLAVCPLAPGLHRPGRCRRGRGRRRGGEAGRERQEGACRDHAPRGAPPHGERERAGRRPELADQALRRAGRDDGIRRAGQRAAGRADHAVRVDHRPLVPGEGVPDGLVRRRPGPGWSGGQATVPGHRQRKPDPDPPDQHGGSGTGALRSPSPPTTGRRAATCSGWTPSRGRSATCRSPSGRPAPPGRQ